MATQPTEPTADTQSAPNGLQPEHHRLRDRAKLDALRQLQTETAVALAARAELEETFDQRLAEIAGEATNQLTLVREELKNARAELADWQQKAQDTSNTLQLRETQLDRQSKELALAQESLAQTNQDLEELREAYAQKEGAFKELTSAKIGVDTHLHEALNQVDTLTGRVHNIETALQASLVHSSDQEDALLRWQELAESTEARGCHGRCLRHTSTTIFRRQSSWRQPADGGGVALRRASLLFSRLIARAVILEEVIVRQDGESARLWRFESV